MTQPPPLRYPLSLMGRRDEIAAFPLIAAAILALDEAKAIVQSARDDEDASFEAMPERLKNSDRGEVSQTALAALDEALEGFEALDLKAIVVALGEASDRRPAMEPAEAKLTRDDVEQRRYERLPRWAKLRMEALKAAAEASKQETAAAFGERKEGSTRPVVLDYMGGSLDGRELPCDRVEWPEVGVRAYIEKGRGGVTLHAKDGRLVVWSQCANEVIVRSEPF